LPLSRRQIIGPLLQFDRLIFIHSILIKDQAFITAFSRIVQAFFSSIYFS